MREKRGGQANKNFENHANNETDNENLAEIASQQWRVRRKHGMIVFVPFVGKATATNPGQGFNCLLHCCIVKSDNIHVTCSIKKKPDFVDDDPRHETTKIVFIEIQSVSAVLDLRKHQQDDLIHSTQINILSTTTRKKIFFGCPAKTSLFLIKRKGPMAPNSGDGGGGVRP